MSTDHLRALTLDPVFMTRIAAIHALGDIWAMGAAPQAATASLILPRMSAALQERTMSEIMTTAAAVFAQAGGKIIGGHSSLGAELTIGFTVTGLTKSPITLAGAKPGDKIILTKPIGSGTIMAAEMAGKAKGADVIACLELMVQDQAKASQILGEAHAMTDVTGFGLAGHLRGICDA
ncbi:MAG: selenide, water dikinase SelD, partial [Paracoccaceae bacterium]|nr:selenide, water dikinase SelD [Paracoccaceae bacterium]